MLEEIKLRDIKRSIGGASLYIKGTEAQVAKVQRILDAMHRSHTRPAEPPPNDGLNKLRSMMGMA